MDTQSGLSAQSVASSFVHQYYALLDLCPENVHKFYQESSQLGWAGLDGVVASVTTLRGINDKIMSSEYKDWSVGIKHVDAQYSKDDGVIVAVSGVLTGKDFTKKNFNQTFFLAKQEKGFFVLNDIFRYTDLCESTDIVAPDDTKSDQTAPCQNSAPSDTSTFHGSTKTEMKIENGNVEEKSSPSALTESAPQNAASDSSKASHQDTSSVVAPVLNIKVDSPKISYASILAKASHAASSKPVNVAPKADHKTAVSTPKPSSPPENGSSKVSYTSNGYTEGCGVYIGKLPYDVTKHGIMEVVKKFGPIRRGLDSIQIRRHDDGFCCGFVEFESADSARRAVEAHHIYFGEKEAYITHKKASNQGNNNGRGRSSPGARLHNYSRERDGHRVTENGRSQNESYSSFDKGRAREAQPSRQATDRW